MRSSALVLLALASSLVGVASCSTLEQLPSNVCGNGVIEKGEDCDGAAVGANNCNATCRVECLAPPAEACPPAWGCGRDNLCRQTTGVFEPFGSSLAIAADRLTLADFDGDGRKDILATRGSSVSIAYADESAIQPQPTTVSFAPLDAFADIPGVGDINGDGRADIAVRVGAGLGVMRGQQSRALSAAAFTRPPEGKLEKGDALITGDFDTRLEAVGDEVLALGSGTLRLVHTVGEPAGKPLLNLATGLGPLAAPPLLLRNSYYGVPGSVPLTLALAFEGDTEITLFTPLSPNPDPMAASKYAWNYDGAIQPPIKVKLPAGVTVHGPVFEGRVNPYGNNGNNFVDLIITGQSAGKTGLYVAFRQNAAPGYHSAPQVLPPATVPDGMATLFKRLPLGGVADPHLDDVPFAVADLNSDGLVDFVGPFGVQLSNCGNLLGQPCPAHYDAAVAGGDLSGTYFTAAAPDTATGWTSAIIGASSTDFFNSSYIADVITTSAEPGLTLLRNEFNLFAPFRLPTQSPVTNLVSGDFDGDGARDLAFSQVSARGGDLTSVHVAFGDALGIPGLALDLGDVGTAARLVPLRLVGPTAQKDGISDLIVSATTEMTPASFLFSGSTDRQIQSPLYLCKEDGNVPRYTAIGHFESSTAQNLAVIYRSIAAPYAYEIASIDPGSSISATICASTKGPGKIPDFGGDELTLLPIRLDADGKDEVLIHAKGSAKLFVAALGKTGEWDVKTLDLGGAFLGMTTEDIGARPTRKPGLRDVLLWSTTGVMVLWNDGDGALDPGQASSASIDKTLCYAGDPATPDGVTAGAPTGVAAINLDADGEREIAIVTDHATLFADVVKGAKRTLAQVRCAGKDVVHGGGSVTAGDVNGDGVDDLVIAGPGGIQVFSSVPVVK